MDISGINNGSVNTNYNIGSFPNVKPNEKTAAEATPASKPAEVDTAEINGAQQAEATYKPARNVTKFNGSQQLDSGQFNVTGSETTAQTNRANLVNNLTESFQAGGTANVLNALNFNATELSSNTGLLASVLG
jgi:hypothetical protein